MDCANVKQVQLECNRFPQIGPHHVVADAQFLRICVGHEAFSDGSLGIVTCTGPLNTAI